MKICRRIAVIRRAVEQLAAIAEKRAVVAESPPPRPSFRSLTVAEAESVVGVELLAALAAGTHTPK